MTSSILTNGAIRRLCGGKAEKIIQIISDMVFAYAPQKGTIRRNYDKAGREDVRKLLCGEYLGGGSKIWSDSVLFVHYDGKERQINLSEVREVNE